MIEPRDMPDNMNRRDMQFIGGTENFDLWWRLYKRASLPEHTDFPLRIHRVAGGRLNWDIFKLPLRENEEIGTSLHPAERGVTGYWADVTLSWDEVEQIETYLRCFAPWVREDTNDAA